MKKIFLISFVVAAVATMLGRLSTKEQPMSDLLLENVEALAAGEEELTDIACIGSGCTKCPITGTNVAYVLIPFSSK